MYFLLFVGGIVLLALVLNLRQRVGRLEQLLGSRPAQMTPESGDSAVPRPSYVLPSAALEPSFAPVQASGAVEFEKFIAWLKEDWLLKLGAFLLLIGFGWLARYAFLNNWIGPMGRIALGIIAGALFLMLGSWRIKDYLNQGGVFLVLGSTTILLTIFAAREIYDFFTPLSALVVMFLSTAYVALSSVKYNSKPLALISLILAGVAPLLTNSPAPDYVSLFLYLFVVIVGAIWIVALTGQRELTAAALVLVAIYSLPHLFSLTSADLGTLLPFAYAFTAIFFITNTAGILKLKGREIIPDLITAGGNGLFLLVWIMAAAPDEWKSLIISAWMIVFATGAFITFRLTQRREPFYVYAGVGVAMLAAATAVELDGAALTIAYTIESGMVALVAWAILKDIHAAEGVSILLLGPIALSLNSLASPLWADSVIHKHFFVLLILGLVLEGLGLFFLPLAKASKDKEAAQVNMIVGSMYFYALLWLSLHALLRNDDTAVMFSLVVYTIIGLITYFYGLAREKRVLKIYGAVLLGLVVGRLLLVDVWEMKITGRIVTFFIIGALLVSTAFWGRWRKIANDSSVNQ